MQRGPSVYGSGGQSRGWGHRILFVFLILGAVGLMMLAKADAVIVERMRTAVTDVITPMLELLSKPANSITDAIDAGRAVMSQQEALAQLRVENQRLRKWKNLAEQLERENRSLRGLLRFATDPDPRIVSMAARVVGDQSSSFSRSFLVNVGREHGVERGQAVVTGDSLIGRVAEVGNTSARVLLATDIQSRIPVVVQSTHVRGILRGNNEEEALLVHLAETADVKPGQRIVTSGHGGVFPPGLPIGVISKLEDGQVRVRLLSDQHRIEVVRLIDYGLKSVLDLKYTEGRNKKPQAARR